MLVSDLGSAAHGNTFDNFLKCPRSMLYELAVPDSEMALEPSDPMDTSIGSTALEKLLYLHQQLLENLSMTPHRVNADGKPERELTRCSDAGPDSVLSLVDATAVALYDVLQYSDAMDENTIERVLELVQDVRMLFFNRHKTPLNLTSGWI
jgi:hypothetical protein